MERKNNVKFLIFGKGLKYFLIWECGRVYLLEYVDGRFCRILFVWENIIIELVI